MGKQRYPYALHSMNLVLPYRQPQSKQTTLRPKALSPLQVDKKGPRHWTGDYIGLRTGLKKRLFRLLETRKPKHRVLFHKTSPTTSEQRNLCYVFVYGNVLLKSNIRSCTNGPMICSRQSIQLQSLQSIQFQSHQTVLFYNCVLILYVCTYVRTHKYQNSNVVHMTGAKRGSLSVRSTARRVAITRMNKRLVRHVEDSLNFVKKYDQTQNSF